MASWIFFTVLRPSERVTPAYTATMATSQKVRAVARAVPSMPRNIMAREKAQLAAMMPSHISSFFFSMGNSLRSCL